MDSANFINSVVQMRQDMINNRVKMVIQLRRDTTENWLIYKDIIPAEGEPCFDIDAQILKIGDGNTTYENLPAIGVGNVENPQASIQEIIFIETELPSLGRRGKLYVDISNREILVWDMETSQYKVVSNYLEEVSNQEIEDLFN